MAAKDADGPAKAKFRANTISLFGSLAAVVFFSAEVLRHYVESDVAEVLFWVSLPFLPAAVVLMGWGVHRFANTGKW